MRPGPSDIHPRVLQVIGKGTVGHECSALLLVDAVTSLGGVPVEVDPWNIDAIYSGTQKCLSCPPGLAQSHSATRRRHNFESED